MGFPEETRARESVSYASEIASAKALAASGSLEGALQNLLGYEKTARLAADVGATIQLTTAMVEMCHDAKDWTQLNETMMMLSKRRAQLKQAVTAMVQLACTYLDELKQPRYVLYDMNYSTDDGRPQAKIVLIFWSPDDGPIMSKMLYASSKSAITTALNG